jgi:sarcosine oxidase subunit gamma
MSNAVSALNGQSHVGMADVADTGLRGMISVRGDFSSAKFKAAIKSVTGLAVPAQRRVETNDDMAVAWMSPDELLIVCDYAGVSTHVAALGKALASEHALAVNVSDARSVVRVSGAGARDALAKLCPVDLSQAAFQAGMIRRTRLAQVAAAFWMTGEDSFEVICFRSVADYVFDNLAVAAESGAEVGFL